MSNNDNRIKKFLKRFNTNKGTKIIIWILITITVVSYFVFSYLVNNITINSVNVSTLTDNWQYNLFCVLKETCIVVSSGLGINLLVSLLIERKNQNKAFEEFFANDIISSPKFYTSLSEEDKMRMLYALETHYDYKVNAYAFGFIDDGKDAPNVGKEGKVKIKFNDWIFPRDGVAISLHKINN